MPQRSRKKDQLKQTNLTWSDSTELVGLVFEVVPQKTARLFPDYTKTLHAWFLDQVRSHNPQLSACLHDDESKKPFTISGLDRKMDTITGGQLQLLSDQTYRWTVTTFSPTVVQWLGHRLENLPTTIELRYATAVRVTRRRLVWAKRSWVGVSSRIQLKRCLSKQCLPSVSSS